MSLPPVTPPRPRRRRVPVVALLFPVAVLSASGCGGGNFPFKHNRAPEIRSLKINDEEPTAPKDTDPPGTLPRVEVSTGSTALLHCDVSDPDNDPLSFSWIGATDTVAAAAGAASGNGGSGFATLAPASAGTTVVSCIVKDDRGGSATRSVAVVAKAPDANRPPVATLKADPSDGVAPGGTVRLIVTANDPDNDALTYSFFGGDGVAVRVPDPDLPASAVLTAPATPGDVMAACVVKDAKGATTAVTVTIPVRQQ